MCHMAASWFILFRLSQGEARLFNHGDELDHLLLLPLLLVHQQHHLAHTGLQAALTDHLADHLERRLVGEVVEELPDRPLLGAGVMKCFMMT